MLGFHADGIRLFGASDTLVAALKKHKLPLVKTSTTNTLVFAVNTAEPLTKKLYLPSFLAPQAPWFSCFVGDAERPAEYSLHFAAEEDLVDFILSMYYCAQGFLHLDFDLAELVTKLNPSPEYVSIPLRKRISTKSAKKELLRRASAFWRAASWKATAFSAS